MFRSAVWQPAKLANVPPTNSAPSSRWPWTEGWRRWAHITPATLRAATYVALLLVLIDISALLESLRRHPVRVMPRGCSLAYSPELLRSCFARVCFSVCLCPSLCHASTHLCCLCVPKLLYIYLRDVFRSRPPCFPLSRPLSCGPRCQLNEVLTSMLMLPWRLSHCMLPSLPPLPSCACPSMLKN